MGKWYAILSILFTAFNISCWMSHVNFTIERYDIDAYSEPNGSSEARTKYKEIHPSLVTQEYHLIEFQVALENYKRYLMSLNYLFEGLKRAKEMDDNLFGEFKAFLDDQDAVKVWENTQKYIAKQDPAISKIFEPLEQAIAQEIVRIKKDSAKSQTINPLVLALWKSLQTQLTEKGVLQNPQGLKDVYSKITDAGRKNVIEKLKTIATPKLEEWHASSSGPYRKTIEKLLDILKKNGTDFNVTLENLMKLHPEAEKETQNLASSLQLNIDLIPRVHEIYQDMSDPFLQYIASHPENWQELSNKTYMKADGDTQAVLVFENSLDARWKYVSVDPTEVILARLRIARKVAEVVTTVVGIAAKAYGVPIPIGILGAKGNADQTIDFSIMTAEESLSKKRTKMRRSRINALRSEAEELLRKLNGTSRSDINSDNIKRILQQLDWQLTRAIEASDSK